MSMIVVAMSMMVMVMVANTMMANTVMTTMVVANTVMAMANTVMAMATTTSSTTSSWHIFGSAIQQLVNTMPRPGLHPRTISLDKDTCNKTRCYNVV